MVMVDGLANAPVPIQEELKTALSRPGPSFHSNPNSSHTIPIRALSVIADPPVRIWSAIVVDGSWSPSVANTGATIVYLNPPPDADLVAAPIPNAEIMAADSEVIRPFQLPLASI